MTVPNTSAAGSYFRAPPFELGRFDFERVGRELEWQRITQIVEHAAEGGAPTFLVLLGSYGAGKTFLLTKLQEHILETRLGFANRPVRFLPPEGRRDFIRNVLFTTFRRGIDLEGGLLNLLDAAKPQRARVGDLFDPWVDVIFGLADPETRRQAFRILTGGRITRSEATRLGNPDIVQIKDHDDAISVIFGLQVITKWAGRRLFAWLLDELEYIDQLPVRTQTNVFDSIKDLWDRESDLASREDVPGFAPLLLGIAATPTFWQAKQRLVSHDAKTGQLVGLVPFLSRIPEDRQIEIPSDLTPEESRLLIANRMSEVREGEAVTPIVPFTDDYIGFVQSASRGVPRRIIEICDTVLTAALREGLSVIDREAAERILRDLLITYEAVA